MRKRHKVALWGPNRDGSYSPQTVRLFTSIRSAGLWASRLNERHCGATMWQVTRWIPWVAVTDLVTGSEVELDRPLVMSVGERGVW